MRNICLLTLLLTLGIPCYASHPNVVWHIHELKNDILVNFDIQGLTNTKDWPIRLFINAPEISWYKISDTHKRFDDGRLDGGYPFFSLLIVIPNVNPILQDFISYEPQTNTWSMWYVHQCKHWSGWARFPYKDEYRSKMIVNRGVYKFEIGRLEGENDYLALGSTRYIVP